MQVMVHQGTKMMTIPLLSGGDLQTGDQPRFGIQIDMRFVAKEIFGLFHFLSCCGLHLPFVLNPPAGIRIMRPLAFFHPLVVFAVFLYWLYCAHYPHLNGPELHPALQGNLDHLIQHLFENFDLSTLVQPFPKDCRVLAHPDCDTRQGGNCQVAGGLVDCVVVLLVTWGFILVGSQKYAPDAEFYKFTAISTLAMFIIELIFLALGILLGCAMKKYKASGGLAIGVLQAAYFLSIAAGLSKSMENLKYVTPFKYFDPFTMLRENRLEWGYVLLSLGLIAVFMVGSYLLYKRRDLYI